MVQHEQGERAQREEDRSHEDRPAGELRTTVAGPLPGRKREEHVGEWPQDVERVPGHIRALRDLVEVDRVCHRACNQSSAERQWEPGNLFATVEKSNHRIGEEMVEMLLGRIRGALPAEPQLRLLEQKIIVTG